MRGWNAIPYPQVDAERQGDLEKTRDAGTIKRVVQKPFKDGETLGSRVGRVERVATVDPQRNNKPQ